MAIISKHHTDNTETPTNTSTQESVVSPSHTGSRMSTSSSSKETLVQEQIQVLRRSNRTIKPPDRFGEWTI